MSARIVEVIESVERVGNGRSEADPARLVTRYYTRDGELLADRDSWAAQQGDAMRANAARYEFVRDACLVTHNGVEIEDDAHLDRLAGNIPVVR